MAAPYLLFSGMMLHSEMNDDHDMLLLDSELHQRSTSFLDDIEHLLSSNTSDLHHIRSATSYNHHHQQQQLQVEENDHHAYSTFLEDLLLEEEEEQQQQQPISVIRGKGKRPSKNMVSERHRRQRINQRLYSLRAIVPSITKMDKASIVGDAISYVKEPQNTVQILQADIAHLELTTTATTSLHHLQHQHEHNILELEISEMEKEETYEVRIECKKEGGVLIQLIHALETLSFDILNANLTSLNDRFLNSLIVKVNNTNQLKIEQLREMMLDVIPKFGLHM